MLALLFFIHDHFTGFVLMCCHFSALLYLPDEIRGFEILQGFISWHCWASKPFRTGFHHWSRAKTSSGWTIASLYFLQVIYHVMHWGQSSQLSSHLHFGQTRDCGDMRSAKDQPEPPLPSPGFEEQQKGHQTKGGPSVSQWLRSLLPS